MPRTRIRQDQVRVVHRQLRQVAVPTGTQSCKVTSNIPCGWTNFFASCWIFSCLQVHHVWRSHRRRSSPKGRQVCCFTAVHPMNVFRRRRTTKDSIRIKWRSVQDTVYSNDCCFFINQRASAILLYNTMPAESMVKVVKRKKDDSQGEILNQRRI